MSRLTKEQVDYLRDELERGRQMSLSIYAQYNLLDTIDALESQLALNQAAILREAAGVVKKWNFMACSDKDGLVADILAIPTDQPALERHDAELLKEKELAVVQHVKGGWHDGCRCEPCTAVREIVKETSNARSLL